MVKKDIFVLSYRSAEVRVATSIVVCYKCERTASGGDDCYALIMDKAHTCEDDEQMNRFYDGELISVEDALIFLQPDVVPYVTLRRIDSEQTLRPDSVETLVCALAVSLLAGLLTYTICAIRSWLGDVGDKQKKERRRFFYHTTRRTQSVPEPPRPTIQPAPSPLWKSPVVEVTPSIVDHGGEWTRVQRRWSSWC